METMFAVMKVLVEHGYHGNRNNSWPGEILPKYVHPFKCAAHIAHVDMWTSSDQLFIDETGLITFEALGGWLLVAIRLGLS